MRHNDFVGRQFADPQDPFARADSLSDERNSPTAFAPAVSTPSADEAGSAQADLAQSSADTFGSRVRRERMRRALSQVDLARMLGVSKVTVWNWENDNVRPRERALTQLSNVLGVPVKELLFGNERVSRTDHALGLPQDLPGLIAACKDAISARAGISPEDVEINLTFGR